MRFTVRRLLQVQVLVALLWLAAPVGFAMDNSDCFTCHGDKTLVKTDAAGKTVSLFVDEAKFKASIHAKNLCTSCHSDITDLPHPDHFSAKPVTCAQCHRVETEIYLKSDHGQAVHKGVQEAASCKDCHGSNHYLLNYRNPQSPVYRTNLPQTCGRCHGNVAEMEKFNLRQRSPVVSYEKSVHGIALLQKGEINAAVCTDCHGSHDLHRSTNPAVQALLAERSRHLRQMPRKRQADLQPQRSRHCGQGRGARRARLHRLPWRAHHHRGQAGHLPRGAGQHP